MVLAQKHANWAARPGASAWKPSPSRQYKWTGFWPPRLVRAQRLGFQACKGEGHESASGLRLHPQLAGLRDAGRGLTRSSLYRNLRQESGLESLTRMVTPDPPFRPATDAKYRDLADNK